MSFGSLLCYAYYLVKTIAFLKNAKLCTPVVIKGIYITILKKPGMSYMKWMPVYEINP